MIYTVERFSNKKIAVIFAIKYYSSKPSSKKYWAPAENIEILYAAPDLGWRQGEEMKRFYQFIAEEMLNKRSLIPEIFK